MVTWFYDREITIFSQVKRGNFHFETDKGESGDVVATSVDDIIEKIKFILADDDTPGVCSQGYDMSDGASND
jgi:hypothetical protein